MTLHAFGCVGDQSASLNEAEGDADVAEAMGEICRGRILIEDVTFLPETIHWEDPAHLLSASEGAGPRNLSLSIASSVTAEVSVTIAKTPADSDISKAVGFNVSEQFTLEANSTILVPAFGYARLEAYPLYQPIVWNIVCGRHGLTFGSGIVYKPIGVYFATSGVNCLPGGPIVCSPGAGAGGAGGSGGAGGAGGSGGAGGAGGSGGAGGAGGSGGAGGAGGSGGAGGAGGSGGAGGAGGSGGAGGAQQNSGSGGAGGSGGP
ncbi:hypothetical protein [Polyangium sp. y55x31]|uniref:hypothetical protein n=1 Tax=Polyangium sp. y55x31 TaxID=3042688 RepID=UPI002482CFA5|nr:hypothetical protein [Polyangium sp. y55x31]MDI1476510.1 hypothetical protein [Polyangium sp. y55x31]